MTICGIATGAERGFIYIRGEYPGSRARDRPCDRAGAGGGPARPERGAIGISRSTSRFAAAAAPTSAARRRRSSIRSKASAASRDRNRHSPRSSACSASRPSSTTSRRSSTFPTSSTRAARCGRRTGTPGSTGTRLFCLSGHVTKPGLYEIESGRTLARGDRIRRRHPGWPCAAGDPAGRRGGHVRRAVGARHAAVVRRRACRQRDARLWRDHGVRRHRRSPRHPGAHRRVLPA